MIRLLLLALVVVGLAPGTFVRTATGLRSDPALVTVTPVSAREGLTGGLTLTGAWELDSTHGWFGGFSALVANGATGLIAGSDRGWLLDLDLAGAAPRPVLDSFRFIGVRLSARKEVVDLEALARDPATDPATGTLWAAFENVNLVMRLDPDGASILRRPPQIAGWSKNSGPETLERLADGRFMMLAEGSERGHPGNHPGLLFAGDPAVPGIPVAFNFVSAPDYDPVDATQLPDGRVLILLRRVEYAIPARFDTAVMVADPRTIRAGEIWEGEIIQRLSGAVFGDNFEGIAYVPSPDDPARGAVWLIADDNFSVFQRTLLVRFAWSAIPQVAENEKRPG